MRIKFIKERKIYLFKEEQEIFIHFFLIEYTNIQQTFNISLCVKKKILDIEKDLFFYFFWNKWR